MVTNYFTLRALVAEWQSMLGYRIGDAWSQERGELTLGLYRGPDDEEWAIKISTTRPMPFIFRYPGHNRPKKNVTPIFEEWWDREIAAIEIADRDRFIRFGFAGGDALEIIPFGPRANVLLMDQKRTVLRAFRNSDELEGEAAPDPSPAPALPDDAEALQELMNDQRGSIAKRLSRAIPLFDRMMAAEVCFRAGIDPSSSGASVDAAALLPQLVSLIAAFDEPAPVIYRDGRRPAEFALTPMHHLREQFEEERFDTLDEALRSFVRGSLARQAFDQERDPLVAALEREIESVKTGLERMAEELAKPSRADVYERNGHLLMAHASTIDDRSEEARVDDLFGGNGEVVIRLDPEQSVVQNAERYYARARRTRKAREHAEHRLESQLERQERLEAILAEVRRATTAKEVRAIREREASTLRSMLPSGAGGGEATPWRRFEEGGYEILVGRSARHNDRLTFGHARKFDLWLHARGVAGSHVIIRRNRDEQVPRPVVHRAAGLAAWFSKARGSSLVPVIMTEKKYVRSAKGGPPGAVIVEREEVLMVEPRSR